MKKYIGILMGDAAGIGPELVVKVLSGQIRPNDERFLIIGDYRMFRNTSQVLNKSIAVAMTRSPDDLGKMNDPIIFFDTNTLDGKSWTMGENAALCGKAVLNEIAWARRIYDRGLLAGLFYAPLNKYSLHLAGSPYHSEQKLFMDLLPPIAPVYEINICGNIWTNRVTSHIPLREVADALCIERVLEAIATLDNMLKMSGHWNYRIDVAGLNPHAGENGIWGTEEQEIIAPAVKLAVDRGINARGPLSADTIFINARNNPVTAVVSMYHDQGQIALKLIGFDRGVTYQSGFPIPIVTPAHGTAFDIAGKGIADVSAVRTALGYLCKVASTCAE